MAKLMTRIKVIGGTGSYYCTDSRNVLEHRPGYTFVYDLCCTDYDWLVVFDELPRVTVGTLVDGCEPLCCPRERTILCTWEPVSIKSYSPAYVRQFGHLLTNRPPEAENHPHYHLGRGYYLWFNGRTHRENSQIGMPPKTKLISAVCSSKRMRHTKHYARYQLVEGLTRAIPEIEWYGHGVRPFGRKFEVQDPYKYHVVVENHISTHHWTEKLADAFLSGCLPFYAGDPSIFEVFPEDSLIPIPMDDPEEAVRIVKSALASGEYERRREAVEEARRLVLDKYNFWDQVIALVEAEKDQFVASTYPPRPALIRNRVELRRHSIAAVCQDLWLHVSRDVRKRLFLC